MTLVYKITLCRRLCQILYVKFYSFIVLVLVLMVVGLVLEICFWSRSCSRPHLIVLVLILVLAIFWSH